MTSGFRFNGTDLDNLFYTDNGNAGALGFKVNGGTDLGNRYTNASTLNSAVGFRYQGKDIGYLRGKITGASVTGGSGAFTLKNSKTYIETCHTNDDAGAYSGKLIQGDYTGYCLVSAQFNSAGTAKVAVQVLCKNFQPLKYMHINASSSVYLSTRLYYKFVAGSTVPDSLRKQNVTNGLTYIGKTSMTKGSGGIYYSDRVQIGDSITVSSNSSNALSTYFTFYLREILRVYASSWGVDDLSVGLRVQVNFTNSVGSTGWTTVKDLWIA